MYNKLARYEVATSTFASLLGILTRSCYFIKEKFPDDERVAKINERIKSLTEEQIAFGKKTIDNVKDVDKVFASYGQVVSSWNQKFNALSETYQNLTNEELHIQCFCDALLSTRVTDV